MSIYALTLPTLSLLLNVCQLGVPTTVSKLIAKRKYPIVKIMQVSILLLLFIDLILGTIYIILVPSIANNYLKNSLTYPTLYGMVLLLPLISLTSLIKGYFIGIGQMEKTNICQISEEIARLLFVIIFVDFFDNNNVSLMSFFAMFSTIVGEIASLIHLLLLLNKKSKNIIKRVKNNNENNKEILVKISKFSFMNTSTKLVGSFIYFLEPIIYTHLMIKANVSQDELTLSYGIVNSYVLSLILLPIFFSNAISMYMFPKLSNYIENKNIDKAKKILIQSISTSFTLGFVFLIIIYSFPELLTSLLYGKVIGIEYIKKYSFSFSLIFIQMPLHIALISLDKEKVLLLESIICNLIRIICFVILIPIYKIDGMIISILISTYISLLLESICIFKSLFLIKNKNQLTINIKS